jgi:uncharacterized protein YjiS (DUF1127 family)
MTTYIPQHYAAATLFRIGAWLRSTGLTLRRAAERLDFLIATRRKVGDDRRLLGEMSARELRDIGLGDAYSHALRAGDFRHGHEASRAIDWRYPM